MDEIKGIARVKFHPGKVEEWKRLSEEAMEIVRTRSGAHHCSGRWRYSQLSFSKASELVRDGTHTPHR
jgi:hypothetical protein